MYFTPQFIKTDVTAIKVFKHVTFVGIGATLHIFCNKSIKLIFKLNIEGTRGEQIFGIVPFAQDKILLYGGNFLLLFATNQNYNSFHEIQRATFLDWILDAKLINNETKIASVSMQNKLEIWDIELNVLEIFECKERCILYSAHICFNTYKELTILSGTVFNEVLIWKAAKDNSNYSPVLKRLQKHEGVIFSLQYNEKSGLICSTSDDRSAILWKVNSGNLFSELDQEIVNIFPVCQVYGHLSRVFRCLILKDYFITGGEDSVINIWTLAGELIRKIETNQGSPIWAVDYDPSQKLIVTGGGNGGVHVFSLNVEVKEHKICLPNEEKPKIINILSSNNIIAFSENGRLYLYKTGSWMKIEDFEDLKSYVVLKVSRCRKTLALAGFNGQIYIYKENNETLQNVTNFQSQSIKRIISLHWLSCDMILICGEEGKLTLLHLKQSKLQTVSSFVLPSSSQRCTTTATIFDNKIVVGDRKGNIHVYIIDQPLPIQTLSKVHSHLGITNLIVNKNNLISLGRNSILKIFSKQRNKLVLISSDKVPFSWLLDYNQNFITAFSGHNFIIWNYETKRILLEKVCGGGHRSWDFFKNENILTFIYIKDALINTLNYDLNINKSCDLVEPFHLKEVNCMNIIKIPNHYILISGGEDTTLKITMTDNSLQTFKNLITLKSHLSSIRCVTTHKLKITDDTETYLIITAGGRAQIVCWTLEYNVKFTIRDIICRENHSYYEIINCEESETRIMDLCVVDLQKKIVLFAACSDGFIKIFFIERNVTFHLELHRNIFYKLRCVFKVFHIRVFGKNVLITLASDGDIVFWDIDNIFLDKNVRPFGRIQVHQSGINTFSKLQINSDSFLFLTAGDDNTVALNYLKFKMDDEALKVQVIDKFLDISVHWAQITGSFITDNYLLTSSVDQRLVLFKWKIENDKIECAPISKYNSPVADLKGLICFNDTDFDIFIYGLGVELLKLVNKEHKYIGLLFKRQ